MDFHFRRHKFGASPWIGRRDERFGFGPMLTPVQPTSIRQGRTKTGGLLAAVIGAALLLVVIALFIE